jgi:outer membrane protein
MSFTRIVMATSAAALLIIGTADAEFVGLNLGVQPASTPFANKFYSSSNSIDVVDDLDVERAQQPSMVLILEHPIAVLPNIRYQGYNLDSTDSSTTDPGVNFNGGALNSGNLSASSFDLNHDNIVLYYQLLNNWIDLDMGVDLKRFDGRISSSGQAPDNVDIDETIPLLHLSARVDLPISGLYVGADINANFLDLGISPNNAQDSTIKLGFESRTGLGIEGGFKSFSLQLNDADTLNTDLEYDGLFLNGYYNF